MHPRYQSKLLQLCLLSTVFMLTVLFVCVAALDAFAFLSVVTRNMKSENCKHLSHVRVNEKERDASER